MMNHIYLIGMMGSGKSVTGKRLAALLDYRFTDMDELLVEDQGKSIREIFSEKGEDFFRDVEHKTLNRVSGAENTVTATGGGIVTRPENVELMRQTGTVVYLRTALDCLWQRVKDSTDRPLLKGEDPKEALSNLFKAREALYEQASHVQVQTDGRTAQAVAEDIQSLIKEGS